MVIWLLEYINIYFLTPQFVMIHLYVINSYDFCFLNFILTSTSILCCVLPTFLLFCLSSSLCRILCPLKHVAICLIEIHFCFIYIFFIFLSLIKRVRKNVLFVKSFMVELLDGTLGNPVVIAREGLG